MKVGAVSMLTALGCLLLAGAGAAEQTAGPQVAPTSGVVEALAADGGRVAVMVRKSHGDCDRILVWDPGRRSIVRVGSRKRPCLALSTGQSIPYVALADRRVAWVWDGGGNFHDLIVRTATIGKPLQVAQLAYRNYNVDSLVGRYAGNVHGDGDLLVYGTWTVCEGTESESSHPCPPGKPEREPYDSGVHRVRGTRSSRIASDPGELGILGASAGRVAALRSDGRIAILSGEGKVLKTFPFAPGEVRGATLDGRRLVVLRRSAGRHTIDSYDVSSAAHVSRPIAPPGPASDRRCSWPVVSLPLCRTPYARLRLVDAENGIAVYVLGRELHVLRIADGAAAVVRPPATRGTVEAQLERSGLFYAYQVADAAAPGRVAHLPYSKVVDLLR
jgi:hypothetical protein